MGVQAQSRATKAPSVSCTPTPTFHASQGHPPVTHTAANEEGAVGLDTVFKTTSTWSSDVRGLCDGLIPHPRKKTFIKKDEKENNGTDNTKRITRCRPTANGERTYVWPLGMYDHCTERVAYV
jgi:hypothetical protein